MIISVTSLRTVAALAAAVAIGAAADAHAGTANVSTDPFTGVPEYSDRSGADDAGTSSTLVLSADADNIIFDDTQPLETTRGCVRDVADNTIMRCPKSSIPGPNFPNGSIRILLRGGGDTLRIDASTAPFFVFVEGGDGSDVFDESARSGPHLLNGGQGGDRVDYRARTRGVKVHVGGGPGGEEGEGSSG